MKRMLGMGMLLLFAMPLFAQSKEALKTKVWGAVRQGTVFSQSDQVFTIALHYAEPKTIREVLGPLFPSLVFTAESRTRQLSVRCFASQFEPFQRAVKALDKPLPQLKVDVQVIELAYNDFSDYKSLFSDLSSGFKMNFNFKEGVILPSDGIESTLVQLTQKGKAKLLAKPTLAMIENTASEVKVGDKIPYVTRTNSQFGSIQEVQFLETGVGLKMLPKLASGNSVIADVDVNLSGVKLWKKWGDAEYPILASRSLKTLVKLEHQKTLVIAGLLHENDQEFSQEMPILSAVPLLGDLFKAKNKRTEHTDIVFLITPEIVEK